MEESIVSKIVRLQPKTRVKRNYVTAYMSCPAHIEIFAEEKPNEVAKEKEAVKPKLTRKRAAQLRVKAGGGVDAWIRYFNVILY